MSGQPASPELRVSSAYRAPGVDYTNNDSVFDVVRSGPIIGTSIKF